MIQALGLRLALRGASALVFKLARRRVISSKSVKRAIIGNKIVDTNTDYSGRDRRGFKNFLKRIAEDRFPNFAYKFLNSPGKFAQAASTGATDYMKSHGAWVKAIYNEIWKECNRTLNRKDRLSYEAILAASEMEFDVGNDRASVRITFSENFVVDLSAFKSEFTYRDPSIGRPAWHPTKPYIQTSAPKGIIHDGASKYFKRYAYDGVTIFGKKFRGSRRANRFAGLGYEPIGIKPKSSGRFPKDYRPFIRDKYPGRNSQKDTLVGSRGRVSIFLELFNNQAAVARINKYAERAVSEELAQSSRTASALRSAGIGHQAVPIEIQIVQRALNTELRP